MLLKIKLGVWKRKNLKEISVLCAIESALTLRDLTSE